MSWFDPETILYSLNSCFFHREYFSCAVDTLLDLFCFGIVPQMTDLEINEMTQHSLTNAIIEAFRLRLRCNNRIEVSECREEFWSMLCLQFPSAFVPKGTINANIDEFLSSLTYLKSCQIRRDYDCSSELCDWQSTTLFTPLCLSNDDIHCAVPFIDVVRARLRVNRRCVQCGSMVVPAMTMPKFLFIALPGTASQINAQERLAVFESEYTYLGCIHATGNHFCTTVRTLDGFVKLDNLNRTGPEPINFADHLNWFPYYVIYVKQSVENLESGNVDQAMVNVRNGCSKRKKCPSKADETANEDRCFAANVVAQVVDEVHKDYLQNLSGSALKRTVKRNVEQASSLENGGPKCCQTPSEFVLRRASDAFHNEINPSFSCCTACGIMVFSEEQHYIADKVACYACSTSRHSVDSIRRFFSSFHTGRSGLLDQLNVFERRFVNVINAHTTIVALPGGQIGKKGLSVHFPNTSSQSDISCPLDYPEVGLIFSENVRNSTRCSFLRVGLVFRCLKWLKRNNCFFDKANLSWISFWAARFSRTTYQELESHTEYGIVDDNYVSPSVQQYLNSVQDRKEIPQLHFPSSSAPIAMSFKDQTEAKAFVSLFPFGTGAFEKPNEMSLTLLRYIKWRLLLHDDSRFRKNLEYVFWCLNVFEMDRLSSRINVALKSAKSGVFSDLMDKESAMENANIATAESALKDRYFTFFSGIRGTSGYWNSVMLDLLAKIRTIGPPIFFVTLSADDNNWSDVADLLASDQTCNTDVISSELSEIGKNPVLCAKQFCRRWKAMFRFLKKTKALGQISDHFCRVEFQARGSPHLHIFLWINGAPNLDTQEGRMQFVRFVDTYISTVLPDNAEERALVQRLQTHRHSAYCLGDTGRCKFDYPRRACSETRLLDALNLQKGKKFYETRRDNDSTFINAYNLTVLKVWKANMDIQIVGRYYGACAYACSYVCKAEPKDVQNSVTEMVHRLRNDDGCTARQVLFKLGRTVLATRLVSAQEAAFCLLGLRLVDSSRSTIFIPCNFPEFRQRVFKEEFVCANMDKLAAGLISTDELEGAFKKNIIDYYMVRPKTGAFERMTLQQFASWFVLCQDNANAFPLLDGESFVRRRTKMACVRTNKTSQRYNPELYYLRLLMLHYPFRAETDLVKGFSTAEESFKQKMDLIDVKAVESEYLYDDILGVIQQMRVKSYQGEGEGHLYSDQSAQPGYSDDFFQCSRYRMVDKDFFERIAMLNEDKKNVQLCSNYFD